MIEQEIGLTPGDKFRGRLLILHGQDIRETDLGALLANLIRIGRDSYVRYLGNDHWVDLFPFNIPIINEYAHWTSPITFVVLRAFFGRHEDVFEKALFVLRSFNARIARLMGVKLIVTDANMVSDANLVYETMAGAVPLRIFSLDHVNVGQYSPIKAITITSAAQALAAMSQPSFDPEREVVTEVQLSNELVPGKLVFIKTNTGPSLHVRAESTGRSILVLPFEFSHCLRLHTDGPARARLIPVNLQQVGFLFEGVVDGSITYSFGPFEQPGCRREDLRRANELDLRHALKTIVGSPHSAQKTVFTTERENRE